MFPRCRLYEEADRLSSPSCRLNSTCRNFKNALRVYVYINDSVLFVKHEGIQNGHFVDESSSGNSKFCKTLQHFSSN